jgi:hypothetical protein
MKWTNVEFTSIKADTPPLESFVPANNCRKAESPKARRIAYPATVNPKELGINEIHKSNQAPTSLPVQKGKMIREHKIAAWKYGETITAIILP